MKEKNMSESTGLLKRLLWELSGADANRASVEKTFEIFLAEAELRIEDQAYFNRRQNFLLSALDRIDELMIAATRENASGVIGDLQAAREAVQSCIDVMEHVPVAVSSLSSVALPLAVIRTDRDTQVKPDVSSVASLPLPLKSVPAVTPIVRAVDSSAVRVREIQDNNTPPSIPPLGSAAKISALPPSPPMRDKTADLKSTRDTFEALLPSVVDFVDNGIVLGGNVIDQERSLKLRILVCDLRAVRAHALDQGVGAEINPEIDRAIIDLTMIASLAFEPEPCGPLTDIRAWDGLNQVSESEWHEVSEGYHLMMVAALVWHEYADFLEDIPRDDAKFFIERAAATQSLLRRRIEAIKLRDHVQFRFFSQIRDMCQKIEIFSLMLRLEAPLNDLTYHAREIFTARDAIRVATEKWALQTQERMREQEEERLRLEDERIAEEQRQALQSRRDNAIAAVILLLNQHPTLGNAFLTGARQSICAAERKRIIPPLIEVIDSGIPASNAVIRNALMKTFAPLKLLEGEPRLDKIADAISKEYVRRGLNPDGTTPSDSDAETSSDDAEVAEITAVQDMAVFKFLSGKHVAIVGGMRRQSVLDGITEKYGAASSTWIETEPTTKAAKVVTQANRQDVVLYAMKTANHQIGDKVKAAMKRKNGTFVILPRGIGIQQIGHSVYEQAANAAAQSE